MKKRWYTVYDGDDVIASGTARECARQLGVKVGTVHWYATSAARRRGHRTAVSFEMEEVGA